MRRRELGGIGSFSKLARRQKQIHYEVRRIYDSLEEGFFFTQGTAQDVWQSDGGCPSFLNSRYNPIPFTFRGYASTQLIFSSYS